MTAPAPLDAATRSERLVVLLVGAVQFVNILDFMMVMPLGPDFAAALHVKTSSLGVIGAAYTASAGVAGLVGSSFLDRFDRRTALALAMLGLVIGTASGGFATGLTSLVLARVVAGAFGGPATSIALSIIADVVPVARRGRAMGAVMGAFSVASVLGVPAGLALARHGGWRAPFFAVAGLGAVLAMAAVLALPSLRGHLAAAREAPSFAHLLARRAVRDAYLVTACMTMGAFALIPNISAFVQLNLGFSRDRLDTLYLAGGVVSFFSMRLTGRLVDRLGASTLATVGCAGVVLVMWAGFGASPVWTPPLATFIGFMLANSTRNVAVQTLASRVPGPAERARFTSLQSAVQHFSSAAGALAASTMLTELPSGQLVGMPRVVVFSMGLTALVPIFVRRVERAVAARPVAASAGRALVSAVISGARPEVAVERVPAGEAEPPG